ncbi:MAG: alpha/beta hydrolase [Myxococcales bacterium]|nr:alpha/beta hydrolase [Myxococcales bacterium]
MTSRRLARPRRTLALLALATLSACLSADPFFFNGREVDGYDWDADPPDPDLEGDLEDEAHPSRIGPESRVEGVIELAGREVHYVYAHRDDAAATIFYSHGNHLNLGFYWQRVELMWSWGYNVLIYDYPSYGLSTGDASEQTMYENAEAALELLPTLPGVDPERVFFIGFSLGGAPATEMAIRAQRGEVSIRPRGLLTESAFCSAEALVQDGTWLNFSGEFLVDGAFDNCGRVAALDPSLRTYILHGTADSFVVPRHAEFLKRAAGDGARLEWFEGAEHSKVPLVDPPRYEALLREFLTLEPAPAP